MDERARAEEHLRVIRSLMERATIYRAISAPTALIGGSLSLLLAVFLCYDARSGRPSAALTGGVGVRPFLLLWFTVLAVTLAVNTWFIWRKARLENGPVFSPGLKLAIQAAIPPVLVAALITLLVWIDGGGATAMSTLAAAIWILFYGLALLSTSAFSPKSLVYLGWAFLATGLLALLIVFELWKVDLNRPDIVLMGLSFGLYHLVYAALTWPRRNRPE